MMKRLLQVSCLVVLPACASTSDEAGLIGRWADVDDSFLETIEFFADGTMEIRPAPEVESVAGNFSVLDETRMRVEFHGVPNIVDYAIASGRLVIVMAGDSAWYVRDTPARQRERSETIARIRLNDRVENELRATLAGLMRIYISHTARPWDVEDQQLDYEQVARAPEVKLTVGEATAQGVAIELRHGALAEAGCVFVMGRPTRQARLPNGEVLTERACSF